MSLISLVVSGVLLGILAWQDFRNRTVSVWLLALLGLSEGLRGCLICEKFTALQHTLQNSFIIISMVVVVWIYTIIRKRRWMNLFREEFGLADFILLIIFGVTFSTLTYLIFILCGFLFALLFTLATRKFSSSPPYTVPLAGYLGIWAIIVFILIVIFPEYSVNDDKWLFNLIVGIA